MSLGVRWKNDNRQAVKAAMRRQAAGALSDAAEFLREEADRTVPIEEATLAGSGGVDVDAQTLKASVYYDTPYAVRQHEDQTLRHDPGRRAKWLEATFRERGADAIEHIRRALGLKRVR